MSKADLPMGSSQPQILIVVMGLTGSGKSTFINLASGSKLRVGHSIVSCTTAVDVANPFNLDGRKIILYDTPGFNDTNMSETEVLKIVAGTLEQQYRNNYKLHGIIYLHRICDIRVGGLEKANFGVFRKLCGEKSLKNVVIVTNMWSRVLSQEEGKRKVDELQTMDNFFKPAIRKGARLMHHTKETVDSAHDIIRSILENHPVALDVQEELVDQNLSIEKTSVGQEVDKKIGDIIAKYEKKLQEQFEAAEQARRERDEETREELLEEVQKAKDEIAKLQAERRDQGKEYVRFRNQSETKGKRQVTEQQRKRQAWETQTRDWQEEREWKGQEMKVHKLRGRERKDLERERKELERERKDLERERKDLERERKDLERERKELERERKDLERERKALERERKGAPRAAGTRVGGGRRAAGTGVECWRAEEREWEAGEQKEREWEADERKERKMAAGALGLGAAAASLVFLTLI